MRLVVDTDVIVAALRSPTGASAALLVLLLKRQAVMLLSVAIVLEYETICMMAEHRLAAGASERDVQNLLDALVDVSEPIDVHYQWRPQLTDAGDEMVLEAAVNGRADAIVTFKRKDYGDGPSRFGIEVLKPVDVLQRIRKMTAKVSTFPLRLPISLKAAVEKMAAADGTSMNQFLVVAAAEKLSAITTAEAFFAERKERADPEAAIRFLTRKTGGEAQRADDILPNGIA